jgi:PmbA protein
MKETTTANAGRAGFRSTPEVAPTNFFVDPGDKGQETVIQEVGHGLFVTEAMGVHTADPISGDFSFGATGQAIEHGDLAGPIRGVTIAGNIKDLLVNVADVADDLRFLGSYGSPSIAVSELMVSGA